MACEADDKYWDEKLEDHDFTHDPATDPVDGCEWCDEYLAEIEAGEAADGKAA